MTSRIANVPPVYDSLAREPIGIDPTPTIAQTRDLIRSSRWHDIMDQLPDALPDLEEIPELVDEQADVHEMRAISDEYEMVSVREVPERHIEELNAVDEYVYRSSMRAATTAQERPATRGRTMRVYLKVNGLEAYVLLDTGSTINAISPDFCKVAGI